VVKKPGDSRSPWADLLNSAGKQLLPVLLTAGSLIGFVAFAGAVIVWTRFSAAEVPADQAVNAVPRDELVAIGSSLLLVFGFFGVLAVVAIFLIDRGGRVSPGMSRGLLVLLAIEGLATIVLVKDAPWQRAVVAVELFVLPMAVVLWATFSQLFTQFDETGLPDRKGEERDAVPKAGPFRARVEGQEAPVSRQVLRTACAWALGSALVAAAVALLASGGVALYALMVGLATLALVLGSLVGLRSWMAFYGNPTVRQAEATRVREKERQRATEMELIGPALASLGVEHEEEQPKPPRLELTPLGVVLVAGMLTLAVLGPSLVLWKWSLAAALGAAIVLGAGLWRIAALAAPRFQWYGLAVFISVPLFGTLTAMARNIEDPQVQPLALIRSTDGPDEAIQGLYVTEADDRIYFATVATEGCSNGLMPQSGRLLWVPKSEVVAMSIGPTQDVKDAATTALEMSYALTPGLGLPPNEEASTDGGGEETGEGEAQPVPLPLDKRLEDVGTAVRPNFGAGLSLVPENASPGRVETLRMSIPNRNVEGFGSNPHGRTLRLGTAPVAILREPAHNPWDAEFVKSRVLGPLILDKRVAYEKDEAGNFQQVDEGDGSERPLYVRLNDKTIVAVNGEPIVAGTQEGGYLAIEPGKKTGEPAKLEPGQTVESRQGLEYELKQPLLRQAWHKDHISFRVPEDATSGVVSVDCGQLGSQPLLSVTHAPEARIAVRMRAGSNRVSFDSGRSGDKDGESISRRWNVAGLRRGNKPGMSADLPPRLGAYSVRLTVTDKSGKRGSIALRLLRLPASLFAFGREEPEHGGAVRRARRALMRIVSKDPPTAIEIAGHADDPGTPRENTKLSLRRGEWLRDKLLPVAPSSGRGGAAVQVRVAAYGEGCPVDPRPGRRPLNRRVDVFVLDRGVTVEPPAGCHPRRLESSEWRLPSRSAACSARPSSGESPLPANWEALLARAFEVWWGEIRSPATQVGRTSRASACRGS
jgi:hypothetical protein